jgi:hypothetical protein
MRTAAIFGLGLLLATAPASAQSPAAADPPEPARQCFSNRNVNSFAQQDHRTINIRVGVRDYYRLTTMSDCRDVAFARGIGVQSHASFICSGLDLTLLIPDSIGSRRCEVRTIHKLTEEEVAALPRNARP